MNELTLVVMAAGMGSRFGGLKQITPVDEDGNFLIDYSVYDAIKAGFKKVVFIIKEENLEAFKETIGKRIEDKIPVEYAFQKLEDIPSFMKIPEGRVKPWGTTHAILAAKDKVKGPFAVINADDFYGYDSYHIVAEFLKNNTTDQVSIPYPFNKVDSKFGSVKRGVLFLENEKVTKILECSIEYQDEKVIASPLLNPENKFEIEKDHPVSMNMFGFQRNMMDYLEEYFHTFMKKHINELDTIECLLPECLEEYLEKGKLTLQYRISKSTWLGVTYKEDLEGVKQKLKEMKERREYPSHLWFV